MFSVLSHEYAKKFLESLNIGYKDMGTFKTNRLKIQVVYNRPANH